MRAIERRSYLRVPDTVIVEHAVVSTDQYRQLAPSEILALPESFTLRKDLYQLELEAWEITREIAEKDRKLGSYIHNINQRFEHLARAVMLGDEHEGEPNSLDVSPAGISYISSDLFPAETLLALKLVFVPSQLGITTFGRVSYSLLGDNDQYRIGVQFTSLDGATESLLTRHLTSLQTDARRKRLHGVDSS